MVTMSLIPGVKVKREQQPNLRIGSLYVQARNNINNEYETVEF